MNQELINKFLTEKMGKCWHEWKGASSGMTCIKCGYRVAYHTNPPINFDFFTWEGFGKLWEWDIKQEWWKKFVKKNGISWFWLNAPSTLLIIVDHINPEKFAIATAEFLGYKEVS